MHFNKIVQSRELHPSERFHFFTRGHPIYIHTSCPKGIKWHCSDGCTSRNWTIFGQWNFLLARFDHFIIPQKTTSDFLYLCSLSIHFSSVVITVANEEGRFRFRKPEKLPEKNSAISYGGTWLNWEQQKHKKVNVIIRWYKKWLIKFSPSRYATIRC